MSDPIDTLTGNMRDYINATRMTRLTGYEPQNYAPAQNYGQSGLLSNMGAPVQYTTAGIGAPLNLGSSTAPPQYVQNMPRTRAAIAPNAKVPLTTQARYARGAAVPETFAGDSNLTLLI